MSAVIILLLVGFFIGFAIWWFFFKEEDEKKETEVTIKADGTITESFVPYPSQLTEYFVYTTNTVAGSTSSGGTFYPNEDVPAGTTISISEDDPTEYLYYKSSVTDRPSIWDGATRVSWERYRDCPSTEGCVKFDASNKEMVELFLNDMHRQMAIDILRPFRMYLVSVNLETPEKMTAKFLEYVPEGFGALLNVASDSDIRNRDRQFTYDIIIKGYADYKGVSIPDISMLRDSREQFNNELDAKLPGLGSLWEIFQMASMGIFDIKNNKFLWAPNPHNPPAEVLAGKDMDIPIYMNFVGIIIELKGRAIQNIKYEPPTELLSAKQLENNFHAKLDEQVGGSGFG